MRNERNGRKAYIVYIAAALALAVACAWLWELFLQTDPLSVVRVLSDCFLLPGVLLVGCALLGRIAAAGTFDLFGYALSSLFPLGRKGFESYYDYRAKRDGRRGPFNLPMLAVGLAFLLLGVLGTVAFFLME